MTGDYLMIHKSVLPDYFEKVLAARQLVESGKAKDVSCAARMVGISRSTYYKYKDFVMAPAELKVGRNAVLSMLLMHETGTLSAVLSRISGYDASVLTITQSLPIHGRASVTLTLDISALSCPLDTLLLSLETTPGVEKPRLIAVE